MIRLPYKQNVRPTAFEAGKPCSDINSDTKSGTSLSGTDRISSASGDGETVNKQRLTTAKPWIVRKVSKVFCGERLCEFR